jgi:hypothetical protein
MISKRLKFLKLYKVLNIKETLLCILSLKNYFEFDRWIIIGANHPKYKKGNFFIGGVWLLFWLALLNAKNYKVFIVFLALGIVLNLFRTQKLILYNLKDTIEIYEFSLVNSFANIDKKTYLVKNKKLIIERFLREPKIYEGKTRGKIAIYLISIISEKNNKLELTFYSKYWFKENNYDKLSKKIAEDLKLPYIDMTDETKKL